MWAEETIERLYQAFRDDVSQRLRIIKTLMNHQQEKKPSLRFLAISGSLRAASSNTALLRAAISLAPLDIEITLLDTLGELPHFNPDLDGEEAPFAVVDFRMRLRACDAVLICSPEYAHGVPGTLKNALDWIVGSGELMEKPVALISASRSAYAPASLREILGVMMAQVNADASITVLPGSNKLDEVAIMANPEWADALRGAVSALARAVELRRDEAS
jgi:chromate reductase